MFNVRLAGGHLYGKQLFIWLSLVVSFMASFVLSFSPLDVLDGILDLLESVSEGFLTYSFNFVRAAVACAILERTSGLEPSSETTAPRYLKLVTLPNFCPFTFISLWMSLALFVISLVFSALTSILYSVQVLSRLST